MILDVERAADVGRWESVHDQFNFLPVHVALLPTGKVLAVSGSGNEREFHDHPHAAEVWDPVTGEIHSVDQILDGDLFCSGQAFLADGRILVAGGIARYEQKRLGRSLPPFRGLDQSYLFDPWTESWTRSADLSRGRWCPALVQLADGRVVAVGGFTDHFPWTVGSDAEVFTSGQGWSRRSGVGFRLPPYPRLHLLPDGHLFYAGSFSTHYDSPFHGGSYPAALLDVDRRTKRAVGSPHQQHREEGLSVLLPLCPPHYQARVLLAGGGYQSEADACADADVIELDDPNPTWRVVAPMNHARYHVLPVLLPNRHVFVVGGRGGDKEGGAKRRTRMEYPPPRDPRAVLEPELFDPDREAWRTLAPMAIDRLERSSALLLPDGRVATFGSNPSTGVEELGIEIFSPPYLFQGPRPRIETVSRNATYGEEIEIETPDAAWIDEVALVRPGVSTHGVNSEQRYVGLDVTARSSTRLRVRVPANPAITPAGYYLLFILRDGIPSVGSYVLVSS